MASIVAALFVVFFGLTFVAWRRYLWAAEKASRRRTPALQLDGRL